MTASACAPVLLLIFNRADLAEKVFAMLQEAKPSKLFISADGPRNAQEKSLCDAVRAVTEKVDWPCEVHRNYAEKNQGCKLAVANGITWFFEHVEAGIILEDDCLSSLSFFDFATTMLKRYANDTSVGHIGGFNPIVIDDKANPDYYYLQGCTIWGWASWRRVWRNYDINPVAHGKLKWSVFNGPLFFKLYFIKKLYRIALGNLNTWDFQYQYMLWKNNLKSIMPAQSLMHNIGFDVRSTHTQKKVDPAKTHRQFPQMQTLQPSHDSSMANSIDAKLRKLFFNRNPLVVIIKLCYYITSFYMKQVFNKQKPSPLPVVK